MRNNLEDLFSVTEVELVYRNQRKANERPLINSSKAASDLLLQSWDQNKIELLEQFKIILLDRKSACIGISTISTGGMAATVVDPKVVFATALKAKAINIILAHNHPSGSLKPSEEDLKMTKRLAQAGKLLDIKVLDHLILNKNKHYSMSDEGVMPR